MFVEGKRRKARDKGRGEERDRGKERQKWEREIE